MAFNPEDKIKWTELAPSLQKKFTDIESIIKTDHSNTITQMSDTRTTISRIAPQNPVNNKEIWADEKYRVMRAFSENFWEFTRAGWAEPGTKPIDPDRETPPQPPIDIKPATPTRKEVTFLTAKLTSFGGQINPSSDITEGTNSWMYRVLGTEPKCTIAITKTLSSSSDDLLAYILIAIGKNGATKDTFTGTAIKIDGTNNPSTITIDVPLTDDQCVTFDIESLYTTITQFNPSDIVADDFTKFDTTQYPYVYPVSKLGTAITPADKPVPPFVAPQGTIEISITCSDVR